VIALFNRLHRMLPNSVTGRFSPTTLLNREKFDMRSEEA